MPDANAAQQDQQAVAGPSGWAAASAPVEEVAGDTASPTPSPSCTVQQPPPQPEPHVSVGTIGMVHLEISSFIHARLDLHRNRPSLFMHPLRGCSGRCSHAREQ